MGNFQNGNGKRLFTAVKNETELMLLEHFKSLTWFCLALVPCFIVSSLITALRGAVLPQFFGGVAFTRYFLLLAAGFVFGYVYEFLMLVWLRKMAFPADENNGKTGGVRLALRALLVWFLAFLVSLPSNITDLIQAVLPLHLSSILIVVTSVGGLFLFYRFATLKAFIVLGCTTLDAFKLSFKSSAVKGYFKFLFNLLIRPLGAFVLCSVVGAMILALFANAINVSDSQLVFFVSAFSMVVVLAMFRYYPRVQLSLMNYAKQFMEYKD